MAKILSSAQMRGIEAAAIASGAVTGLELMERAGAGVVAALFEVWPELEAGQKKAIVLCGPGNNGGDGFVIARLLKGRGWAVAVSHYTAGRACTGDAQVMQTRWRSAGDEVWPLDVSENSATFERLRDFAGRRQRGKPVLVIDALFGIGLTRPIMADCHADGLTSLTVDLDDLWMEGDWAETLFVAVDVPSGLCADSGRVLRTRETGEGDDVAHDPRFDGVVADLTVTFHTKKHGHILADGPRMCGKLRVVDIGLPQDVIMRRDVVEEVETPDRQCLKKGEGHKFDHGHSVVLSGGAGRGGAARLAARAALRTGAGLVTVCGPAAAMAEHAARLDAVMLREVSDAAGLTRMLGDRRIRSICLGPGLGLGERQEAMVAAALEVARPVEGRVADRPLRLVLDADALTLLGRDATLFGRLHENCVLTPHEGEFARMFPDLAGRLADPVGVGPAFSKVEAARAAAARAGCVVLFKGADTVIASPLGHVRINAAHYDRAAPWLATAGSGDVLAGIITGLLARGWDAFEAACAGAWLHVECAREFGPGLIAEDLPEMLPAVFRRLGV